ncbi:TRAP transporter permease [uncultured Oscillibacter sp.]|uniref:TRAP transporter permease n=1 Tax=uncultured Oscillibacter sp. TaxID=876091 RepID=UPI0025D8423F|nr:TRAP transporter permease [uncultured Oscillibacter sp.]
MSEKDKNHLPDVEIGTAAEMEEVMRKYDRESATRIWEGRPKALVSVVMALFSVYCIWLTLRCNWDMPIRLSSFLGLIIVMGYLTYPARKDHVRPNSMPWYDVVLMVLGAGSFFYYCVNYMSLAKILTSAAKINPFGEGSVDNAWFYIVLGIVGVACLAELCRRCVGLPILCVAGVLLVYTFASGQNLARVVYTLFYGTSGVMATPVQVCAKFIAVFIIFGAFLERTGISNFFIDLANSLAGSTSGGPAKVAVISSALCGMVSGSSVGNTVTTGSVTIPMMKRTGYQGEFAGAVEAAASTGGQIMPPIMGAAAFLMAEFMDTTYADVALKAILPAFLYFTGIFIAVHLEARRLDLKGIPRDQLPKFGALIKSIYLLLPLVVLVWMVSTNMKTLQFSAAVAIGLAILVSLPHLFAGSRAQHAEGVPARFAKDTFGMIVSSLEAGGRSCITVAVACSVAGIVSGCITVTGLASKLINGVIGVSRMIPFPALSLFIALFLTMLCCIVLGMGVPTTANYCIMASTCAPILIQLGIGKIPAHFFVFYFGIVADITPPVALAAYAGSAIAKSNPMKTGINATKLAIAAFIVPYIFAYSPEMLFVNVTSPFQVVQIVISALLGIFGVAAALNGFLFRPIPGLLRLALAAAGLAMMIPGALTDVVGLAALAAIILFQRALAKRAPAGT